MAVPRIAVSLVLLGSLLASPLDAKDWAKPMFDKLSHDFGTVARGATVEHRFVIENRYEQDVRIVKWGSSCGCTIPRVTKDLLKTWETAELVAELDTQLGEMKIFSPTNCVLEVLSVKVGDVVAPNQQVATLLLTNHIWVRVFVTEPWLGHIKLGDVVKVRVDSFAAKDFSGTVEQIARSAEFTPRNVQTVGERVKQVFGVKVKLDNAEDQLRAGMAADVVFPNVPK